MIAQRVAKQSEIDASLFKEFGIKPTGKYTKDGTQQLYTKSDGRGLVLPAANQGYSWYFVEDILAHVREHICMANTVSEHEFIEKPDLKLIEAGEDR